MSIDGRVKNIIVGELETEIELESHNELGVKSITGQDSLFIEGETPVMPEKGDFMWGGAGSVILCRNHQEIAEFERIGYTRLRFMWRREDGKPVNMA